MKNNPLDLTLEIQVACEDEYIPEQTKIETWVTAALNHRCETAEIGIRLVSATEIAELNQNYRNKAGPTNILSFAYSKQPLSGDMAICASIVNQEAKTAGLEKNAHWAHIIVHGVLHLLGFDHEEDNEAEVMEKLETKILSTLGVSDPYE
jgi:probable rRNA maturation factor